MNSASASLPRLSAALPSLKIDFLQVAQGLKQADQTDSDAGDADGGKKNLGEYRQTRMSRRTAMHSDNSFAPDCEAEQRNPARVSTDLDGLGTVE